MPINNIPMIAINFMLTLLLQKPSKTSKAKNHLKKIERGLKLWGKGYVKELA